MNQPNQTTPSTLSKKVVSFIVDHPWLALLFMAAFVGLSLPGFSKLKTNFDYRQWFAEDNALIKRFQEFERTFGNDESSLVVIHNPNGVFNNETLTVFYKISENFAAIPGVQRVDSILNFDWVHADGDDLLVEPFFEFDLLPEEIKLSTFTPEFLKKRRQIALDNRTMENFFISSDAKTTLIRVKLLPSFEKSPNYPEITKQIDAAIAAVKTDQPLQFYAGGMAHITAEFSKAAEADVKNVVSLVILLIFVVIWIIFRRLTIIPIVFFCIIACVVCGYGYGGWAGLTVNNITAILPQILLCIAIADAIHILTNYFQFLDGGKTRYDAAFDALEKNFAVTIFTTISTCIGFLSLASPDVMPLFEIGIMAASGTVAAWLLTYFFIGPLLVLIPFKARPVDPDKGNIHDRIGNWISAFVRRHRMAIRIAVPIISIIAITIALDNTVNSDPIGYFSEDNHVNVTTRFVEANITGSMGVSLTASCSEEECIKEPEFLKKVGELEAWVKAKPYVKKVNSILDIFRETNRSLNGDDESFYRLPDSKPLAGQLLLMYTINLPMGRSINDQVSIKNDRLRLDVLWTLHNSNESIAAFEEILVKAKELNLNVSLDGKGPIYQYLNNFVIASMKKSTVIALVGTTLFMCFILASIKLGLLSMIPNILPIFFGFTVMRLLGNYIDIGGAMTIAISFGVAVDDTIHFLSMYSKKRREGMSANDAIDYTMRYCAPALIFTSIVLVCGFSLLMLATFLPNRNIGMMTATVLTVALLLDLFLLPALLIPAEKKQKTTPTNATLSEVS